MQKRLHRVQIFSQPGEVGGCVGVGGGGDRQLAKSFAYPSSKPPTPPYFKPFYVYERLPDVNKLSFFPCNKTPFCVSQLRTALHCKRVSPFEYATLRVCTRGAQAQDVDVYEIIHTFLVIGNYQQ